MMESKEEVQMKKLLRKIRRILGWQRYIELPMWAGEPALFRGYGYGVEVQRWIGQTLGRSNARAV